MNASAAVPGWFGITRAGHRFAASKPAKMLSGVWLGRSSREPQKYFGPDGHTITQLSAATRRRYGSRSPYFIPPSFLYQLRNGVTPHVCQIVALSENTGYRFVDWLRIFGFDLHQIPRLQIRLHPERTTLVTPMEDCFEPFLPRPSLGHERGGSSASWPGQESGTADTATCSSRSGAATPPVARGFCPATSCGSIVTMPSGFTALDPVSMGRLLWLVEHPDRTGLQPGEMD